MFEVTISRGERVFIFATAAGRIGDEVSLPRPFLRSLKLDRTKIFAIEPMSPSIPGHRNRQYGRNSQSITAGNRTLSISRYSSDHSATGSAIRLPLLLLSLWTPDSASTIVSVKQVNRSQRWLIMSFFHDSCHHMFRHSNYNALPL